MAGDTFAGFSGRYGVEAVLTTLVGNIEEIICRLDIFRYLCGKIS